MGYRLLAHEGERDNCFGKIILVGVGQGVKSYISKIVELPRNKNLLRT